MARQTVAIPHLHIRKPQVDLRQFTDPMAAVQELHRQYSESIEELRRQTEQRLQRLTEQLDRQSGNRGTPVFGDSIDVQGNRVMRVGAPEADDDAVPAGLALTRASMDATYFDAGNRTIRAAPSQSDDDVVTRKELQESQASGAFPPNSGWSVTNLSLTTSLDATGATLADVRHVLGTVIIGLIDADIFQV